MRKKEGLLIFLVFLSLPSLFGIVRAEPVFNDPNNWNLIGINSSGWSDYQINIHALSKHSSIIENVSPGNSFFYWKTDRVDKYTDISFWKNGNNFRSCNSKDWARVDFYNGANDKLELKFWAKETGPDVTVWVKFPPQNFSPIVPPGPGVIANISDLQKRVENSCDLMGETLLLGNGPYKGNLIINASNFTLKPSNGSRGEIICLDNNKDTIKLNNASHVTISKLNVSGYLCEIRLEGSKNCKIEENTINAIDGCGIYLVNQSCKNIISKNNLTSLGDSSDQPIAIYRSNNNNITCNNIKYINMNYSKSAQYCLKDSYWNNFSIHQGDDFYINNSTYHLGQDLNFYQKVSRDFLRIGNDSNEFDILTEKNWWRCCNKYVI